MCYEINNKVFLKFPTKSISQKGFYASSSQKISGNILICLNCELVYAATKYTPQQIMSSYINQEDKVHSIANPDRIRSFTSVLKRNSKILKFNKVKTILDIGCASGAFLIAAKKNGFEAHGVEPSISLREIAKQKYDLNIQPDLDSLDAGFKLFDMISLWDVLEHVSDPSHMIDDLLQYLKPNGLLLLNLPMIDTLPARILKRFWPFYIEAHLFYFTNRSINRLLSLKGFELILKKTYWQTLSLRYVILRQFGCDIKCLEWIKIRYYLGQRTLIFKLVSI